MIAATNAARLVPMSPSQECKSLAAPPFGDATLERWRARFTDFAATLQHPLSLLLEWDVVKNTVDRPGCEDTGAHMGSHMLAG
jgi:hypothetical protein